MNKNLVFNFFSNIYLSILTIVSAPFLIDILGLELYGIVGFYTSLQIALMVFDFGVTAVVTRETSIYHYGRSSRKKYENFIGFYAKLFLFISSFLFLILYLFSDKMATHWFDVNTILRKDLHFVLILMFLIVCVRFYSGFYKALLIGAEKFVWISLFNTFYATLRFIVVLFVIYFFENKIQSYFIYQLIVSFFELLVLDYKCLKFFKINILRITFSTKRAFYVLKKNKNLLLTTASVTILWLLATQIDDILLSHFLKLDRYGAYSIISNLTNGVYLFGGIIGITVLPKLVGLFAQGKLTEFNESISMGTQLASVVVFSVAATFFVLSNEIVSLFIKDRLLIAVSAECLVFLGFANAFMILNNYPYYFQFSAGKNSMHLVGCVFMLVGSLISLFIIRDEKNVEVFAKGWFLTQLIYFVSWTPFSMMKFKYKQILRWYIKDILPIFLGPFLIANILKQIDTTSSDQTIFSILKIGIFSFIILFFGCISSSYLRVQFMHCLSARKKKQKVNL